MIISDQHLSVSVLTDQSEFSRFCLNKDTTPPSIIIWKGDTAPVVDELFDCLAVVISFLPSGETITRQI